MLITYRFIEINSIQIIEYQLSLSILKYENLLYTMLLKSNPLRWLLFFVICISSFWLSAQENRAVIQKFLQESKSKWSLTDQDINNYRISDQYTDKKTGITHTYLHQEISGIRIFNAVSAMAIRNGQVVSYANRFYPDAAKKVNAINPVLRPDAAIQAAAQYLGKEITTTPAGNILKNSPDQWEFNTCGIADKPIKVELMYVPVETGFNLAWNVNIKVRGSVDWWNIRIDAVSGKFISKNNWTVSCDMGSVIKPNNTYSNRKIISQNNKFDTAINGKSAYNIFPFPLEAPTFGPRQTLVDPNDLTASPFGWHDTDGVDGPEYTITRGNNVFAYEDQANTNMPGYSPDGGANLNFDFPLDLTKTPDANKDAIITNLFYVNNTIHDITYHHGFDELSGNFQQNNYGKGGLGGDYVDAEAQDGGGTSNANFSTPDDGQNGVMQMYLWPVGASATMTVNSPDPIKGNYIAIEATFGPGLTNSITSDAVLVIDDVAPTSDACDNIQNAAQIAGKIVLIDRGLCVFTNKITAAQNAGAIAVVVINNTGGAPIAMPGNGTFTIPSVMISQADGDLIKQQLANGTPVNITLNSSAVSNPDRDGSLDNGIVSHEFGHGVSTRLTGGPSNSNCLNNGEEGGEGWSDWLALILTIEPGDMGLDSRGIGTYALNEPINAQGIRRFPYSTDININPETYGYLAQSGEVHDIGEIWSQVLWDMTWKLIDAEGFDPDWYNGNGGNITAMRLVLEAMKLQPCGPGFLDARDAILSADNVLYNDAHRCMIWEAFAGRGMGVNAIQGSADVAGDEVENFDVPSFCKIAVLPPKANFVVDTISSCYGNFHFTDKSTDIPQEWLWDFGDNTSSTSINPSHTYTIPGTYTVKLTVTNTIGQDNYSIVVTYNPPAVPGISGDTLVCAGNSAALVANVLAGNTANWYENGKLVFTGTNYNTDKLSTTTTFNLEQLKDNPLLHVGPIDNTFGSGGNHNTGFDGRLLFEAFAPFKLKSVYVYAQGANDRTFTLYDQGGKALQSVTVAVPNGGSRVELNFDISSAGKYSLGNVSQNLYRNNGGAKFPYKIDNLVSIYQSNATNTPLSYYYYFYDWEVQESSCVSPQTSIKVNVTPGPVADFSNLANKLSVSFTDKSSGNPTSWFWDFGDGSSGSILQNPTHVYLTEGTFIVSLTVSDGLCTSSSQDTLIVKNSTSVNNTNSSFGVNLFPNPASSEVTVQLLGNLTGPLSINVIDAVGKLLKSLPINKSTGNIQLNTAEMNAGLYYIQIKAKEGVVVKKLTIIN